MAAGAEPNILQVELTDEEKRVLRECRVNSLYLRGIPLGGISVVLTRLAGKSGFIPQFKRFAVLYYPGVFTLGVLAGIASYRRTCFEKIMKLENSRLADQVREFYSRAGIPYDGPKPERSNSEQQELSSNQVQYEASEFEAPPHTRSGSPGDEHVIPGASSWEEPSGGSSMQISNPPNLFYEEDTPKAKYTTYEELRKKNRNRWQASPTTQHEKVKASPDESNLQDLQSRVGFEEDTASVKKGPPPKRNKYGDIME